MHGGNHLSINKSLTDTRKRLPGFVLRPETVTKFRNTREFINNLDSYRFSINQLIALLALLKP
jgi:hypothetical protein